MDYINYTRVAEFEYMPISYQTGSYDAKWTDKLCVQNYKIGAVMTEMYTRAEHLVKNTEVRTRGYQDECAKDCCTGVLEANVNSNVFVMPKMTVDPNYCKGCGLCIIACPKKIIRLSENINAKGYNYAECIDRVS